ncbi:hypothetical protein [Pseudoteredinibacter isoporae]|uniref:PsiF repeat-containing protein n=1 Tax=Pseudoteredinibacter isoporae TaxID=570281 RepID=A0A7X0MVG2_9GAMM|nr:hypothetical protein [Pseudoteredinibacter isoporae]MBB6521343.1 hypothetical protein [Pseudoteredinibacter isoporae]NHO86898.1 hypothetical protein [Pseudoteredinibacter isoporae]NIB24650.1 hypothetical protein [Pseudoteredinibacter isoporae]
MKSIKLSLIPMLAIAALATSPAYAADEAETAKKSNKKICKKYRPTGTRIAKKTCMTQRGWDELKRRAQDAARTSQRLSGHQNREEGPRGGF